MNTTRFVVWLVLGALGDAGWAQDPRSPPPTGQTRPPLTPAPAPPAPTSPEAAAPVIAPAASGEPASAASVTLESGTTLWDATRRLGRDADGARAIPRWLGGWTASVETSWTDSRGFTWQLSSAGTEPALGSPFRSSVPVDPATQIRVRATRLGPAGLRFTGEASNRRGYHLPPFMTDPVGSDARQPIAGTLLLDPARYPTVWDTRLRVERAFQLRGVDLRLVGEASATLGRATPLSAPGAPVLPPELAAQRLTGRALRFGVVIGF